jgi:hypothetical protein
MHLEQSLFLQDWDTWIAIAVMRRVFLAPSIMNMDALAAFFGFLDMIETTWR